ncbi:MAG: extensin family protein, partial [Pseudomonadota bacterium]
MMLCNHFPHGQPRPSKRRVFWAVTFLGVVWFSACPSPALASDPNVQRALRAMDWQVPTPHFRDEEEEPNQPVRFDPPGVRDVGGDEPLTSAEEERGPLPEPPVANLACRADLKKLARFQLTQTPATDDPYCVIPDPVVLQSTLGEARVTFGSGLVLDCAFALKLAGFISGPAQQLARQHRGSVLTNVITGQGFDCRRRNNAPSGKLSEHALGNGVDVVGFVFADGRRQSVV